MIKQSTEDVLSQMAAEAGLGPDVLEEFMFVQQYMFLEFPIVIHFLGGGWNEEDAEGFSEPMQTFEKFKEFEDDLQQHLGISDSMFPAECMQQIREAAAMGYAVSVFHFLRDQGVYAFFFIDQRSRGERQPSIKGPVTR